MASSLRRPGPLGRLAALAGLVGLLLLSGWALRSRFQAVDPIVTARSAYERRDWGKAAELARLRLKAAPDDEAAMRMLARAAIRQGRDDSGIAIYSDRLGTDRMEPEDFYLLGLTLQRQGNLEMARNVWTRAAAGSPEDPELLRSLADLELRTQRLEEAVSFASRLSILPGWQRPGSLLLGAARFALGDQAAAVDALSRGLSEKDPPGEEPPDLSPFRKMLVRALLSLGRPTEADRILESLAGSQSTQPDFEGHWLASRSALQQGQLDRARTELARSGSYREQHPLDPEPSPFTGASKCVPCHGEICQAHQATRHARTFHHGDELLSLDRPEGPLTDPDDSKVTHTLSELGHKLRMRTKAGDRLHDIVVDYAFGTTDRYVTMVGRDEDQHFRALRRSFFRSEGKTGWDRTSGDVGHDVAAERVRGQLVDVRDGVVRCLHCHVTNPRAFRDPDAIGNGPEAADSGIGCERCHGPGLNHVKAMEADFPDHAIVNASKGSADSVIRNCRECHIVGDATEIEHRREDPIWVRSPGATLTFSRCFTESAGGLSCLTCHDPHRDSERSAVFYERKCLECHAATPGDASVHTFKQVPCKVNATRDCLSCHMPKVPVPVLHTSLTDHYIRVHREESPGASAN